MEERKHLVLNVDDDEAGRYTKTRNLQRVGFDVVDAASGYDALRKVESLQPSVVLLDVHLPDISGIEVCGVIKERWPNIFVLQTSATFTTGADRTRGLEGGADSYLTQPIEPEELVASVRALLRLREAEDNLRKLNDTLEVRVQERTKELATANAQLKHEIEERQRAQAALVQAQKMEAIGHLTGGIAHDFNNLLTAVIGNLDRIRSRATDPKIARLADNAFLAAERGSKLTAQLLAFSRTQKLATRAVEVNALIESMTDLLTQSLGPSIDLSLQLASDLPAALTDPNQLELAVLNLAINARDALPEQGGEITISTSREELAESRDGIPAGEFVRVTIRDAGHGMTPEVMARAVEPFFTTKPPGKGTGLGLSQVYGIATQAGGAMSIESEVGRGTSVHLYLKVATSDPDVIADHADGTAFSKEETVLIVDDDADVRALVDDYLRELRYRTYSAPDADSALRLLDEIKPDLLIADFAMPGSNGAELARVFRQRFPDAPVLFFSGYADTAALESAVGKAPLLRKPFRPSELAAAIRSMLD